MTWSATQPALDAEALLAAKRQVRERGDSFDLEIFDKLTAAVLEIQQQVNRQLLTTTFKYRADRFPRGNFFLPPAPLASVTTVTYLDTNGDLQTWDPAEYEVIADEEPGFLRPVYQMGYPSDARGDRAEVIVTYTSGYGMGWGSVAEDVQDVVLMRTETLYSGTDWGELYEHRLNSIRIGDEHFAYA